MFVSLGQSKNEGEGDTKTDEIKMERDEAMCKVKGYDGMSACPIFDMYLPTRYLSKHHRFFS